MPLRDVDPWLKRSGHDESVCFSNQPERREGGENQAERVGAAESVNEGLQRAETSLVYLQRLRAVAEPLSHSGRQSGSQLPPGEPRRHRCAGNACLRRRPERAPAVEGRLIFRDVHRRGRPKLAMDLRLLIRVSLAQKIAGKARKSPPKRCRIVQEDARLGRRVEAVSGEGGITVRTLRTLRKPGEKKTFPKTRRRFATPLCTTCYGLQAPEIHVISDV